MKNRSDMTIEEKIKCGILKKDVVVNNHNIFLKKLTALEQKFSSTPAGFVRDMLANDILALRNTIATGEKILKKFAELKEGA